MILLFLRPHYQVFRHQRAHAWVPLYIAVSEARREWTYEGENQPVLVSKQTSTGRLYLPVLVEVVTSTAPRSDQYCSASDQYYFVFYMYRALEWLSL